MEFFKLFLDIDIKQSHIDEGFKACPRRCPIARSLNELGYENVMVTISRIYIDNKTFRMNDSLACFISSFDCGHQVYPLKSKITRAILH